MCSKKVRQLRVFAEKYKKIVKELIIRGTDFATLSLLPADILAHGDRIMCDRTAAARVLTNYGKAVNRRRPPCVGVDSTMLGLHARKSLRKTCIVRNLKPSLALKGQASSSSPLSAGQQAPGQVPTTTIVAGSFGQPICITDSPVLDRKNGRSSVTFNLANQIKREDQNAKREGRTKMNAELATTTQQLSALKNAHGRRGEMLNTARANTEAAFATPHFQAKVEEAKKAEGGIRKFQDLRDHFSGSENNKRVAVNLLSKKMSNLKANKKAAEAEKKQAAAESSDESEFQDSGPDESEDENFKASKIIDVKGKGKSVQYLVEWEGFPKEDNTWEPAANILDKALIAEFKEMVASKKKGPKSRRVVKKRRRG